MSQEKQPTTQATNLTKEWNVMVYMSSDNDLGSECVWALTEMQHSNLSDQIAVLAQFDPPTQGIGTRRYDFTGGISSQRLRSQALAQQFTQTSKSNKSAKPLDSYQAQLLSNLNAQNFDSRLEDFEVENLADDPAERTVFIELADTKRATPVEDNFADWKVLAEFVEKGIERYPAKHYLVILSGYGNSPSEGLLTETSPTGSMKLPDLKKALDKVRQDHLKFLTAAPEGEIDILGLDACLMGMVEVVSELAGTVRYLVASEGLAPSSGWPYRRILEAMSETPVLEPEGVAEKIVDNYIRYYADYFIAGISVDQSVSDLSKVGPLESAVKRLVKALTKSEKGLLRLNKRVVNDLLLAHLKAQTYRFDQHVDLWDFCDCLADYSSSKAVKEACENVKWALGNCLLKADKIGAAFQYSNGLSVYFPWAYSELDKIQDYKTLVFAQHTGWGDFLEAYVKETQRDICGGFKKTQQAHIFPQDGYYASRDNPKIEDVRDNPKIEDVRDNPKIEDVRDNPKIEDVRDNPKIEDVRDLLGGVVSGVLVYAPKIKNPPVHYYKRRREVIKATTRKPATRKT